MSIRKYLASLHLTLWILVVLSLWLTLGIILECSSEYSEGLRTMNRVLIREWLFSEGGSSVLKTWFSGLCIITAVLGVNLVLCSWNKLMTLMRVRFRASGLLMFGIHLVFGLVALGHLGGFMTGYKHSDLRLQKGDTFDFGDQYSLKIMDVRFIDDPRVLQKTRSELESDEFHRLSNFAEVLLMHEGEKVVRDKVFILDPLRHRDIQITLKRFALSGKGPSKNEKGTVLGLFSVSRHPVLFPFLVLYGVMIIGLAVYLVMTWGVPSVIKGKTKQRQINRL